MPQGIGRCAVRKIQIALQKIQTMNPMQLPAKRLRRSGFTASTDAIDFFLNRQLVETREGQREEEADSAVEHHEGIAKRLVDLFRRTGNSRGIGNTPMRGHWSAGPHGTNFVRSVVANREHKIDVRRPSFRELIPTFAAHALCWQARHLELLDRLGSHPSSRLTPRAVRGEIRPAFSVQDGLGHNRPRRIPSAQKQNVVQSLHLPHAKNCYRPKVESAAAGLRSMEERKILKWRTGL
jgi:hypothetical protein